VFWPFVLLYVVIAVWVIWKKAERNSFSKMIFVATALSLPIICLTVLCFSLLVSYAGDCSFVGLSGHNKAECQIGSWDWGIWMKTGTGAQFLLFLIAPLWLLFFSFVYFIGYLWDMFEGR
jgi:hypothetical protein